MAVKDASRLGASTECPPFASRTCPPHHYLLPPQGEGQDPDCPPGCCKGVCKHCGATRIYALSSYVDWVGSDASLPASVRTDIAARVKGVQSASAKRKKAKA